MSEADTAVLEQEFVYFTTTGQDKCKTLGTRAKDNCLWFIHGLCWKYVVNTLFQILLDLFIDCLSLRIYGIFNIIDLVCCLSPGVCLCLFIFSLSVGSCKRILYIVLSCMWLDQFHNIVLSSMPIFLFCFPQMTLWYVLLDFFEEFRCKLIYILMLFHLSSVKWKVMAIEISFQGKMLKLC